MPASPPGCPGSWAVKRVRCLFLLSVEATKRKLEDTEDEVKTLKRRHVNSVKVLTLSLPFNGHFPGEPGLAGVYGSKG